MKLDNDTLKHCIFSLLTGLEIQDVDLFMERLSPANCLKLGRAYAQASRGKVVKMGIMVKFKKLFSELFSVKKSPYADNMPLLQLEKINDCTKCRDDQISALEKKWKICLR